MRVLCSLARSVGLAAAHEIRLSHEHHARNYQLADGHRYVVFRETVRRLDDDPQCVIEVGFRLRLIGSAALPHRLFQRACILTTPFWSGFDGFATKLWMVDPDTRSYAGIYAWSRSPAAQGYMDVLLPVLRAVSVRGSVFSEVHEHRELEELLRERSGRATPIAASDGASPRTTGAVSADA